MFPTGSHLQLEQLIFLNLVLKAVVASRGHGGICPPSEALPPPQYLPPPPSEEKVAKISYIW